MTPKQVNDWRVVPRLLMLVYMVMVYQISHWFMGLPDPSNAQSAFVSVAWGSGAAWFGLYVGGPKID